MSSKLISPDFTEDLVGFMIQSMLTINSFPKVPFALVPLSKKEEVIYGADAWIDSISPIYIQFKRAFAYPDNSTSHIIKDRKKLKANCSPRTLFFELRNKQPKHTDYQHNILFNLKSTLKKNGKGTAFYTAPLFLNRKLYILAVHRLNWFYWLWLRDEPYNRKPQNINTPTGSIRFHHMPFFREHIVIPPHTRVTTHKHEYSYLEDGKDVCFHNPTRLDNFNTLGQTIDDFINFRIGEQTTGMTRLSESNSLLNVLQNGLFGDNQKNNEDDNIITRWLDFGKKLRTNYEIYQFMLIKLKTE